MKTTKTTKKATKKTKRKPSAHAQEVKERNDHARAQTLAEKTRRRIDRGEMDIEPSKKRRKYTTTIKTQDLGDGRLVTTAKTNDPNLDLRAIFPSSKPKQR